MSEEMLVRLGYAIVTLLLIIAGVAMWKAGKEGDEE